MAGRAGLGAGLRGDRPGPVPARGAGDGGPAAGGAGALLGHHPVREHHPGRPAAGLPGRPGHRVAGPLPEPLERAGHGAAGQQGVLGAGRPHRQLPVVGHPVRHRLQPLLARPVPGPRRGPGLLPGPLLPRLLRPVVPGGKVLRRAAGRVPSGGRRGRAVVLPAPVADARLLAVPNGVDGPGAAHGHLPGPVPQVPGRPRAGRHRRAGVAGAVSLAGRERLDNLIFVVNCNLQRLDGPVRGNGKIIQELEGIFRGAGWNVIKVIWGSRWDPLLARDATGLLLQRMEECVDGQYQDFKSKNGAYVRERFFGAYPELLQLVADMSDEEIWNLNRGGHDPVKVYAAYQAAVNHTGQPTVILAKTVKGYGMGEAGEGQNITHQQKKMAENALKVFRDRFGLSIPDDRLLDYPYQKPADDSPELRYLHERRRALGGFLPSRRQRSESLTVPELSAFGAQLAGTGEREISTTMAFVRILNTLLRDKQIGKRVVPIVPDESRTFGMEGMFRQFGIWSQVGQLYQPEDANQLMFYKEDKSGQLLQEGINEPGAMASWIAAATSYSHSDCPMIPFYIYYSMFGFQRVGDLAWAAGDSRARGFLVGGTAGRTTLNGEGLQHEDGHSHVLSSVIPNCISYDPTFAYELAVIIQDGLRRMFAEQEDVFYYLTVMNENYQHPAMPEGDGVAEVILKGMYLLREGPPARKPRGRAKPKPRVQLLGSGTILREVIAGADLLAEDFGVVADVWSAPSFTELRRDGLDAERWNLLHPTEPPRQSYVTSCLADRPGPVVAATDYIRAFADQIRPFVPGTYRVLGTDGYGRSDYRRKLRRFFEVDRYFVALAALQALAQEGTVPTKTVAEAIAKYGIDPDKPNPARS